MNRHTLRAAMIGCVCVVGGMLLGPTISSGQNPSPAPIPSNVPPGKMPFTEPRPTPRSGSSSAAPVNAGEYTIVIEGTKQGRFKGEGTRDANKDVIVGVNFDAEFKSAGSGKGGAAGEPILVTKAWGAASPQIYLAYSTGEALKSVVLEFYQSAGGSGAEMFYTMKLTGAKIVSIRQFVEGGKYFEQLGLGFEKIEVEHLGTKGK